MDHLKFDDLTKAMAGGRSRRNVLKLFGAAAGVFGSGVVGRSNALAGVCEEAGGSCSEHEDCCGALYCDNRIDECVESLICSTGGDFCSTPVSAGIRATVIYECCEHYECVGGYCEAVCTADGGECAVDGDCCDDLICIPYDAAAGARAAFIGTCGAIGCAAESEQCSVDRAGELGCCDNLTCLDGYCVVNDCIADHEACEFDEDCCDGICCAGYCRPIECCIDEKDPNARCPEGTSCFEGVCDPIECIGETGGCNDDYDCCGYLVCSGGYCAAVAEEEVTYLPATGVGDNGGSGGLIAGAALAAGAAAFIAGKRARQVSPAPAEE